MESGKSNYGNTLANLFDESKMDKASIIRHMDTFTRRVKQNIDKKYDKIIREFAGDFSLDAEKSTRGLTHNIMGLDEQYAQR